MPQKCFVTVSAVLDLLALSSRREERELKRRRMREGGANLGKTVAVGGKYEAKHVTN